MSQRFNQPKWHAILVLWTLLCAAGVMLGVGVMVAYPPLGSGWQAGVFLVFLCGLAYVGTAIWLLSTQREVDVDAEHVTMRSWLDVVRGSTGEVIPIREVRSASLVFDSGKKLQLDVPARRYAFWVAMWPRNDLDGLLEVMASRGVLTEREW